MKSWFWGYWLVYESGVDYMNLDTEWFVDIASALWMSSKTALNFRCLPKSLQDEIQKTKPQNGLIANGWRLTISLARVFEALGIKSYEIITHYREISIDELKKQWVIYIWSINDFWDLNIQSIDWHFNLQRDGKLSRNSFRGRNNLPYVLLYNKGKTTTFSERLVQCFQSEHTKVLQIESK